MDNAVEKLQAVGKAFDDMFHNGCSHKIKAFMLNWCFGLKYKKI